MKRPDRNTLPTDYHGTIARSVKIERRADSDLPGPVYSYVYLSRMPIERGGSTLVR